MKGEGGRPKAYAMPGRGLTHLSTYIKSSFLHVFSNSFICKALNHTSLSLAITFITRIFYKNTWFQLQLAVSYFSVYFQPKVFLILIPIFVFEFPEHSSVKT